MKKGTAVPNCGSFCTLRYLTVKKLPAKVIQAKTIPYNQNGKTDRKALAAAYFNKAD